ncbi:MAG: hypothetical protein RL685_7007 [Pseudomonadota bacterium]
MAFGGCAESAGYGPIPDGPLPGVGGSSTTVPLGPCGEGAVSCPGLAGAQGDAACCPAGNNCIQQRCVAAAPCTVNADCTADTVCGGSSCRPWSVLGARPYDLSCRTNVDLPSLRPEQKCHWPQGTPSEFPDSVQVISTPMVVDFDFDGDPAKVEPSIVFVSYAGSLADVDGVLRVIDGADCTPQFSYYTADTPLVPDVSPALGDLDGDGIPEIVAVDFDREPSPRNGLLVLKKLGNGFEVIARKNSSRTVDTRSISIHDADGNPNGLPEILTNTGMFSLAMGELDGLAERVNIEAALLEPPAVYDVNGDRIAEMVSPTGIFNWNEATQSMSPKLERGLPLWNPNQDVPTGAFVGMVELGQFPNATGSDALEMVIIARDQLLVTKVDGNVLMNVRGTGDGIVGGPPVIADFDGDGRMEFASPGRDQITAFDLDCVSNDDSVLAVPANCRNPDGPNPQGILWQHKNGPHGATSGASLFDFDGDQRAELVYADQCFMRIMEGSTGKVLFSVPRSSTSRFEYPVIADVDGDRHTEIVTSSNDNDPLLDCTEFDEMNTLEQVPYVATHGVTVWADADKRWAGSRPIWNQHSYSINNVNDNGTIPTMAEVVSNLKTPDSNGNSLRQNVQGATGISLQLADLTVSGVSQVRCLGNQGRAEVSANLCNRGLLPLAVGAAKLSMFEGSGATPLCEKGNASALTSGKCEVVKCEIAVPDRTPGFSLRMVADPADSVPECTQGTSNSDLVSNVFCSRTPT